ncbi:MAG: phosphatase PAP2 family protein [archaeon]
MLIDITANTFMQSIQNSILTTFSKFIAIAFDTITLALVALVISVYLYFKVSKEKGIFLASATIATGIAIKLLKEIFQRARPLNGLIQESGFAFPSGHVTMTVVFLGLIVYLFASKKHKLGAVLIATLIVFLVGFTRLYLQVHWLTDILASFVIGGIILASSIIIYKRVGCTRRV